MVHDEIVARALFSNILSPTGDSYTFRSSNVSVQSRVRRLQMFATENTAENMGVNNRMQQTRATRV